jgi:hypothetical protein
MSRGKSKPSSKQSEPPSKQSAANAEGSADGETALTSNTSRSRASKRKANNDDRSSEDDKPASVEAAEPASEAAEPASEAAEPASEAAEPASVEVAVDGQVIDQVRLVVEDEESADEDEDAEYGDAFAHKERVALAPIQPHPNADNNAANVVKKVRLRKAIALNRKPRKKIVITEVLEDFEALHYENDVYEFITSSINVPEKVKELRLKELVVTVRMRNGIVEQPINVIQSVIMHVLLWVLITDGFFSYNPIEKTLRHLSTKSFFVVGKSFMRASLYKYLFASATLRYTFQKVHENIKRSVSVPISRICYPDATGVLTTWMTLDHIEVLGIAIDKWSPMNTFRMQQLASDDPKFIPQSIFELIILSFKMCADMEFEDSFIQSTSPSLEAFVLGLLYETFKRRGVKENLKSLGKTSASVGKVLYQTIYSSKNSSFHLLTIYGCGIDYDSRHKDSDLELGEDISEGEKGVYY